MEAIRSLKTIQLDALRETANIGAGHAATALSQMTGTTIMIKVPAINVSRMEDIPPQFIPDEEPVAAVMMHMLGGIRHLIWDTGRLFDKATSTKLAYATAIGSVVLTVLIWAAAYVMGH